MASRRNLKRVSMLLEGYKSNRSPNLQLGEIAGHIVEFVKDRDGLKFVQRKLDDATDHRKNSIFNELLPVLLELMTDQFGNFVVQKFFDVGNQKHRQDLYLTVRENFKHLSLNKYGCRVVQTAVQKGTDMQKFIVFQPCVGDCMIQVAKDPNGNHVLLKSFHCVPVNIQNYLFTQLEPHLFALCLDLYGCRVVQCILKYGSVVHRTAIFEDLQQHAKQLIRDRYGNNVIQRALEFWAPADRNRMIQFILDNVITFSVEKYASIVVERCIENATEQQLQATMNLICAHDGFWLNKFCTETYANYVVQKLITLATIDQVRTLRRKISPYVTEMDRLVSGRKVISKLHERLHHQEMPVAFQCLRLLED